MLALQGCREEAIVQETRILQNSSTFCHYLLLDKIQIHLSNLTHFRRQEESRVTVLDKGLY